MAITLSTLSITLGLLLAGFNLYGLMNPVSFGKLLRRFPRADSLGFVLMLAATGWFMWNVSHEPLSDFETIKPYLFALFVGVGIGSCFFVRDLLAIRGLAVLMLLLAKLLVDNERWVISPWRLVIAGWAYVMVMGGIWFTVSPWRLRDFLFWATANESRIRLGAAARCAFGVLVAVLGFTVFKSS